MFSELLERSLQRSNMIKAPETYMRLALRLARRAYGFTSPNPMVGALLVKSGQIIGRGWHHRAGEPHAEIEAIRAAQNRGAKSQGATLYVTLEPCCTHRRTPPCTDAIIAAGIREVVVGAADPNPAHQCKGLKILKDAGIRVTSGILAEEANRLNEAFNHWIVRRAPFVTVKAAMTLDGKIATPSGESKWITGEKSRAHAMHSRQGSDAILVGINTVLADDPELTVRTNDVKRTTKRLRRIVLDSNARTPLSARVVAEDPNSLTTIVVGKGAPRKRINALSRFVHVLIAPQRAGCIDLRWLLRKLGDQEVTSLLVEGGGEVNAAFLLGGFAHRVAFFYAPKVLCGRDAIRAVGGDGAEAAKEVIELRDVEYDRLGEDIFMTALT
jgi:diaminohydroxyphosphoribosylaminopyrimidine deaminase / 5-amino-6-(5-phosphoribosylamino)uracil reductase